MSRVMVILATLAMVLLVSNAGAFEYRLGYDFGNPFDGNNNYSPINYPYHIGNYPSPGYFGEGGEKFDLEGIHFAISGDKVHVALVNSFGLSAYSSTWRQTFYLGQIFFGFDGNNTSFAIDPITGNLYSVNSYSGIPDQPGSYYNHTVVRSMVGAYGVTSGDYLGTTEHEYTMWEGLETDPMQGDGNTWVLEFAFDRSLIDMAGARSISFHNTLGCGNDLMEKSFNVIPEPTTFVLMGLGLAGAGILIRRRH